MKVKVEFECEIFPGGTTPWFFIHNELKHMDIECVDSLKVCDAETGKEL